MSNKQFPIQLERNAAPHPLTIPWSIAELAYSVYASKYGNSQSLERLAERGGFAPSEMDEFLPDWRLREEVEQLRKELAARDAPEYLTQLHSFEYYSRQTLLLKQENERLREELAKWRALCYELDIEMDGVRCPSSVSAIIMAIRRLLEDVSDE